MKDLTKKEQAILDLAEKGGNDASLLLLEKIQEVSDKFDSTLADIKASTPNLETVLKTVKGQQGDVGEKGDKGDKGDRGDTGEQGKQGIQGIKGQKGETGEKGSDGQPGLSGLDGKDGTNGTDGSDALETPVSLRDKLSSLKDGERLDASAIKNLPTSVQRIFETGMHTGAYETPIKAGSNVTVSKDASGAWVITSTAGGIPGGSNTQLQYNNSGAFGGISGLTTNGSTTLVQTSNSAAAFESGPNGSTNPVFRIVNNTASQADGISITGLASTSGTTIQAISSGSTSSLRIYPKGAAAVDIGDVSGSTVVRFAANGVYPLTSNTLDLGFVNGGFSWKSLQLVGRVGFDNAGGIDTAITRSAAGVIAFGTGAAANAGASIQFTNFTSSGTANRVQTPIINDTSADTMLTASGSTKYALTLQGSRAIGNVDPLMSITDSATGNRIMTMTSDGGIATLYFRSYYNYMILPSDNAYCFAGQAVSGTTVTNQNPVIALKQTSTGASRLFVLSNDTSVIGAMIQNTGGRQRVVSDVTKTDTTFTNITGLGFNAGAARKYTGQLILKCNNTQATEGIKFDFNGGTATMTSFWAAAGSLATGGVTAGTTISTSLAGVMNFTVVTGETVFIIQFSLVVNGAGTVIPRFAENSTAAGTATVELGSFMWTEDTP